MKPYSDRERRPDGPVGHLVTLFMKNKCATLLLFCLFCTVTRTQAQNEPQWAGLLVSPTATNPGSAGRSGKIDATGAFRQQWVGFKGAPMQFLIGLDAEVKFAHNFHGVGLFVAQDKIGASTTLDIDAAYAFHIYLAKGLLGIGARLGVRNVKFDVADLRTSAQGLDNDFHQETDDVLQNMEDPNNTKSMFDVGLGAFYQTELSYLSLSFLHLTAQEMEFKNGAKYKVRPTMHVAAGRLLGQDVKRRALEPRLSLRTDFASWQLEMTLNVDIKNHVWFGAGARIQDALLVGAGFRLDNGLSIAYNYDATLGKGIRRYSSGSHEVGIRYTIDLDREKPTKTYKSVRIL